MRASRLVSLLLTLQARTCATADELAAELDVSVRTIYRDLDELCLAGVPVYGQRGPGGGFRLVDGYQTRLTGLTGPEAEALMLVDMSRPMAALGLGPALLAARLKVAAALPEPVRRRAGTTAGWVHLDLPGWFEEPSMPDCLPVLAEAVLSERPVSFDYRQPDRPTSGRRSVDPLGLVLKGRSWYLVARPPDHPGRFLTYAAWRITEPEVGEGLVERPAGFDLGATWSELVAEFEASLPSVEVAVRVRPGAVRRLRRAADSRTKPPEGWGAPPGGDGWVRLTVLFERLEYGLPELLGLGPDVEVLAPLELREQLAEAAAGMAALYGGPNLVP